MTVPVKVLHFADGEWPDGDSTELTPLSVSVNDQLLDLGTAGIVLRSNDRAVANIAPEDVMQIFLCASDGTPSLVGEMIVDDIDDTWIDTREEANQTVTCSGPLILGALKDGLVEPPGGTGRFPKVEDNIGDYTHPDFDDSGPEWVAATEIITAHDVQQSNSWTGATSWDTDGPSFPDGSPSYVIWASDGTTTSAGEGIVLGREKFTTPFDGAHAIYWNGDNALDVIIDGKPIGSADLSAGDLVGYTRRNDDTVSLSAGEHTIALRGENYPGFGAPNPAGMLVQIRTPGLFGTLVWETTSSMKILEYPSAIPGMTPSNYVRLWLETQQALGRFDGWSLDSTDTQTSVVPGGDREEWSVTPTISMRVGQDDGLSQMLKIMEAYADVRVAGKTIFMWNKDAYTQASGMTLEVGNLTSARRHRVRMAGDELLVDSQLGWTRAGSGGRREAYFPLGPENNEDELTRLSTQELTISSNPPEERVYAYRARNDTEIPYVNPAFVPGSTVVVALKGGGTATDRVVRIGFSWSKDTGEEVVVDLSTKNLILQEQERFMRLVKALGG